MNGSERLRKYFFDRDINDYIAGLGYISLTDCYLQV